MSFPLLLTPILYIFLIYLSMKKINFFDFVANIFG
nr:MAG TPA: hypothetical protein [Caudoviricetes sp.]